MRLRSKKIANGPGIPRNPDDYSPKAVKNHSKRWIRETMGSIPEKTVMLTIQGDSMKPRLSSGDLVYIDTAAVDSGFQDGLWMVRIGGSYQIKQVQIMAGGGFEARSINPEFATIPLTGDNWELLGRAVYRGERL